MQVPRPTTSEAPARAERVALAAVALAVPAALVRVAGVVARAEAAPVAPVVVEPAVAREAPAEARAVVPSTPYGPSNAACRRKHGAAGRLWCNVLALHAAPHGGRDAVLPAREERGLPWDSTL